MARIANLQKTALPTRLLAAILWLAIALTLACAVHAEERASGSASDSLHHSAALAQHRMERLGDRMQATAHKVIDATSRGLHRAFDATARGTHRAAQAIEHAADHAKTAFHNI
jgi:hypothetical protein